MNPSSLLILFFVLITTCGTLAAQNSTEQPSFSGVTSEQISSRLTLIEEAEELDSKVKENLKGLYKLALERLDLAARYKLEADQFRQSIESNADTIRSLKNQLEALPTLTGPNALTNHIADIRLDISSGELEQLLTSEKAKFTDLRNVLSNTEASIQTQLLRPENNRLELDEARKKLDEINTALAAPPIENENPQETRGRLTALEARRRARSNEIVKLEQETISHVFRLDQKKANKDLTQRQVNLMEARVKSLESKLSSVKQKEVAQARAEAEKARREAINKHPVIIEIADENTKLTTQLSQITTETSNLKPVHDLLEKKLNEIKNDFNSLTNQIDIAGIDRALVEIMLDQRRRLPDESTLQREMNATENSIKTHRMNRYKRDEDIKKLKTAEQRLLESASSVEKEENRADILNEATKLLEQKSEYLQQLSDNYGSILTRKKNIYTDLENYTSFVRNYRLFLDEKLIWVPTSTTILSWPKAPWLGATKWLVNPAHWIEVQKAIKELIRLEPLKASSIFAAFSSLLLLRGRMRQRMEGLSVQTRRISTDSFAATSQLLFAVFLIASALPLPVAYLGWALMNPVIGTDFSRSFGLALLFVGCNVFTLSFLHELSKPKGVAELQFRWSETPLIILRKHLFWFVMIVTTGGFVTTMVELQDSDAFRDSLGRFAFIITMAATAFFLKLLIDPAHGIFANAIKRSPEAWLSRISKFWYFVALSIPCALIMLAIAGYYYAAVQLGLRLLATFWLVIIGIVLHNWGLRYFYIHERKIALEAALEKRKSAAGQSPEPQVADETANLVPDEPEVDLSAVKEHPRSLLRALVGTMLLISIWIIWSGVLPALNFLNTFTIYDYNVVIEGNTVPQTTTILDLIKFLMVCVITTAAAKNIPGVLEIALLQNLPLQSGSRYAITTICQYVIVTVGILIAVSFFGIEWGQFGWILAALSVGLGFGLQEIVANFVCGILIFLERPIRVGDIVTVSDVTGIVNRIQIRATTIMNWDRQEFIVPNKEFITGRILNWTLTNTVNRITIPVGIAYGSDTEQARNILLDIAKNHPEILDDPEPVVIFENFGDSSLNFSMRFHLPSLDRRLLTIHDVHTQINKRFSEANIEIPFPQRDIHVRSTAVPPTDLTQI